ncbi:hypothetical protein FLT15_04165 [Paenibacillus thiaminolyticus]|uniref:hypothetical protein n=1 Tax=Paenibacillus thiaminolyticus TaxID=49283 RepID=UPI001163B844|nr:hypothetical protein [Paenibacillus thiaminolyticus]NGP57609.1 hypothetical protein [Paenibacillus thiaminolyticus]
MRKLLDILAKDEEKLDLRIKTVDEYEVIKSLDKPATLVNKERMQEIQLQYNYKEHFGIASGQLLIPDLYKTAKFISQYSYTSEVLQNKKTIPQTNHSSLEPVTLILYKLDCMMKQIRSLNHLVYPYISLNAKQENIKIFKNYDSSRQIIQTQYQLTISFLNQKGGLVLETISEDKNLDTAIKKGIHELLRVYEWSTTPPEQTITRYTSLCFIGDAFKQIMELIGDANKSWSCFTYCTDEKDDPEMLIVERLIIASDAGEDNFVSISTQLAWFMSNGDIFYYPHNIDLMIDLSMYITKKINIFSHQNKSARNMKTPALIFKKS